MRTLARFAGLAVLAVLACFAAVKPAAAQCSSITIDNLNFGSVNGPASRTATGNVTATCTTVVGVAVCAHIGAGSGGATASARRVSDFAPASHTIDYQIYRPDNGVWGSIFENPPGGTPPLFTVPGTLLGGTPVTRSEQMRAEITVPSGLPPGTYLSTFTAIVRYGLLTGVLGCDGIDLLPFTANPTFTVSVTLTGSCTATGGTLDFGERGFLGPGNIDATTTIGVNCTVGTPYTVSLGDGSHFSGVSRRMALGAAFISYGLFKDPGHSQPWGSGPAALTGRTGTGAPESITLYGRIPGGQPTPPPGIYSDLVVVTVAY